ncbi:MAG: helicase-related protein, partial [Syntrophales bacterium]|nr:helicase-related protein [Syntrophales bacterium]
TLERAEIISDLRLGVFDVLVGVNLLREGLDLPEVSLVAILDADREGFLRSERSLMQTSGRAARHVDGKVIMYADEITEAIQGCLRETARRRAIQQDYNARHGITPASIKKNISHLLASVYEADYVTVPVVGEKVAPYGEAEELPALIARLKDEMRAAARELEFEKAAILRDRIKELSRIMIDFGGDADAIP